MRTLSDTKRQAGFTILETLIVIAIIGVISAIAVPSVTNQLAYFRVSGDARSISNALAVVKLRAPSNFTRVRLYVSLGGRWHRIESWNKTTSAWDVEGGQTYLSTSVNFGFGSVSTAPPNTQATIAQAPPCTDNAGADISGTACVMYNSRGVPIDNTLAPTALDAIYVNDGSSVYGITVAASGMSRMWQTANAGTPNWVRQ